MEGKLHLYYPRRHLTLFEYQLPSSPPDPSVTHQSGLKPATNTLLFIGGLYDNFLSTAYVASLASLFPTSTTSPPAWTVMHVQLSSANTAWGINNLDRDVDQIATAVDYVRGYVLESHSQTSTSGLNKADINVVLMGHSTGCQDILHYLHSPVPPGKHRPAVQGAILQAGVSDREAHLHAMSEDPAAKAAYEELLREIASVPEDNHDDIILPMKQTKILFGPTPVSISRFLSLISPGSPGQPSADDLFSSDLTEERLHATFGKVGMSPAFRVATSAAAASSTSSAEVKMQHHRKPSMLILFSGADEYVPERVDKHKLLQRWREALEHDGKAVWDPDSGLIEGGKHDLSGDDEVAVKARKDMQRRVLNYLGRVSGHTGEKGPDLSMHDVGAALSKI